MGGYDDFDSGWNLNPGQDGTPQVFGRPICIVQAPDGSLLVSDDAGSVVYGV